MKYSNILAPVDFSEFNKLAICKAVEVQQASGAELTLAHIIDYMPPVYIRPELPQVFASDELMTERANEYLDDLVEELGIESCRRISKIGRTKSELLELIQNANYDLVVMGKHSQSGIDRLIGSTTNYIVQRARCDVLVVHE